MHNKKQIIQSLENVITNLSAKLSTEEIESLENIKQQILKSKKESEILKWSIEILKLFEILKHFF